MSVRFCWQCSCWGKQQVPSSGWNCHDCLAALCCRKWAKTSLTWWLRHVGQALDVDLYLLGVPRPTPARPAAPPAPAQPVAQPQERQPQSASSTAADSTPEAEARHQASSSVCGANFEQSVRDAIADVNSDVATGSRQQSGERQAHDVGSDEKYDRSIGINVVQRQAEAEISRASPSAGFSSAIAASAAPDSLGLFTHTLHSERQQTPWPVISNHSDAAEDALHEEAQRLVARLRHSPYDLGSAAADQHESAEPQQDVTLNSYRQSPPGCDAPAQLQQQGAASNWDESEAAIAPQQQEQQAPTQQPGQVWQPEGRHSGELQQWPLQSEAMLAGQQPQSEQPLLEQSPPQLNQSQPQSQPQQDVPLPEQHQLQQLPPPPQQAVQVPDGNATAAGLAVNSQQAAYDEGRLTGPLTALGLLLLLSMLLLNTAILSLPCLLGRLCISPYVANMCPFVVLHMSHVVF